MYTVTFCQWHVTLTLASAFLWPWCGLATLCNKTLMEFSSSFYSYIEIEKLVLFQFRNSTVCYSEHNNGPQHYTENSGWIAVLTCSLFTLVSISRILALYYGMGCSRNYHGANLWNCATEHFLCDSHDWQWLCIYRKFFFQTLSRIPRPTWSVWGTDSGCQRPKGSQSPTREKRQCLVLARNGIGFPAISFMPDEKWVIYSGLVCLFLTVAVQCFEEGGGSIQGNKEKGQNLKPEPNQWWGWQQETESAKGVQAT